MSRRRLCRAPSRSCRRGPVRNFFSSGVGVMDIMDIGGQGGMERIVMMVMMLDVDEVDEDDEGSF